MAKMNTGTAVRRRRRRGSLYIRFIARRVGHALRDRLRLQRSEYPSPLSPFFEKPPPLFPAAQVMIGRVLGRGYLLFDRLREHLRIERSRLRDRFGGPRLTLALIRRQGGLLLNVLALIALGLSADILAIRYGRHLAALPGGHFLAAHLNGPSLATLDSALTAAATATGAVLGLVLTISLITFQTTASRYRSDRIVDFLIRERVGSVVVRLLATGFLFSLWLLFSRDIVSGYPPYVSTALAVAVATVGIGSLIVYRVHALHGLAPAYVFLALERESRRELSRLRHDHPGRSIEAHARRTCESDFEIVKDLLRTLSTAKDWAGTAAGVSMLGRLLDDYIVFKRRLPDRSQWFRPIPVRLSADSYGITLHFARLGRLPLMDTQPERDWFEREVYEAVALVGPEGLVDAGLREAIFILHGHTVQLAWAAQEWAVLDRALDAVDALGAEPSVIFSASRGFLELSWVAVYDFTHGLTSSPARIVASKPWRGDKASRLPREARDFAAELGRKIRKELALTGHIVTPETAMIAELEPRWQKLVTEKQSHYLARALASATNHLHAVVTAESATQAATAAETTLRIIVLAFAEGATPRVDIASLRLDIASAYQLAPPNERAQLREEGVWVALRILAERGEFELAVQVLEIASAIDIFEQAAETQVVVETTTSRANAPEATEPVQSEPGIDAPTSSGVTAVTPNSAVALRRFELLLQFAYVYGWGEYHQAPEVLERIAPLVTGLFSLETLLPTLKRTPSALTWPFIAGVKQNTWFQPLMMAIHELPEVPVFEPGAIGYGLVHDHPSPLIRDWPNYGGTDEIVKAMIEAVVSANARGRILELIDKRIEGLDG